MAHSTFRTFRGVSCSGSASPAQLPNCYLPIGSFTEDFVVLLAHALLKNLIHLPRPCVVGGGRGVVLHEVPVSIQVDHGHRIDAVFVQPVLCAGPVSGLW